MPVECVLVSQGECCVSLRVMHTLAVELFAAGTDVPTSNA